ncbi:DUF4375 domain-containing protein [Paenibacillus athensensis]|nr:DUF4375 domain-containing protein [Paenibacillus athensensis]MCD1260242.1 DUF4375 domain-containing protein [Paenibacillus athensensis]
MKEYLTRLLEGKDDDLLLNVLQIIMDKCAYGQRMDALSSAERMIYLLGVFEGEMNNGGFSQYLFNSSGKYAYETVQALKIINAEHTASLLEKSIRIYKNGPTNDGRNEPEEDELMEEQVDALNDLDRQFFAYNDHIHDLQFAYMINHRDEF